ncbi:MAG: hypothetical protein FWD46_00690 [Cystobacterineae bacterium]|nr:hypothetical protein [Cystobacterineae bacterium]
MRILEQDIRAVTDFKNWLQNRPWLWVAGALSIGFVLGVLSNQGRRG